MLIGCILEKMSSAEFLHASISDGLGRMRSEPREGAPQGIADGRSRYVRSGIGFRVIWWTHRRASIGDMWCCSEGTD